MAKQYIRKFGRGRLPINVVAINKDRVLYTVEVNGEKRNGCITKKFFDENYKEVVK